jgi:hypothetical protein
MTPTLAGRIQTRVALLMTVGVLVTLLITPLLPFQVFFSRPRAEGVPGAYALSFTTLAVVAVVGVGWEFLYHALQQFRWDKDWPSPFGLLTGLNEAILAYVLVRDYGPKPGLTEITPTAFLIHFFAVWLAVFFTANGPMRVVLIRWRYRGGRIV